MPPALLVGLIVVAGVLGAVVGPSLNRVADGPERRAPLVSAGTGLLVAAVTWLFLTTSSLPPPALAAVLLAYLGFAAVSVMLTLIDLDTHRLPNSIVLPSYVGAAALLLTACVLGADWISLAHAGIGMVALFAFYFVLRLVSPRSMGGGDVKLAGLIGLLLGWIGWGPLITGAVGAFVLGGVFGAVLIATRKAGRQTAIPFGPWMILGAWIGVFAGGTLGGLILGL